MNCDRLTKSLLAATVGLLGVLALRPGPRGYAADAPPAAPAPAPTPSTTPTAAQASELSRLQVSAALGGGVMVFDAASGDVTVIAPGNDKTPAAVQRLGFLRKSDAGRWELIALAGAGDNAKAEAVRIVTAQNELTDIQTAVDIFEVDNLRYPSTEEGLQALVVQPTGVENWKGPYLKKGLPKDPWGNPYVYRFPSKVRGGYELRSFGPNRVDGGGDDVFAK